MQRRTLALLAQCDRTVKLLLIETSSAIGSVGLAVGDELLERSIATPREQSGLILPLIDELLASAGMKLGTLDAVVFGQGPGSFTGLRVAAAVAQGLALSTGRPLVGVSSLTALAERAWQDEQVQRALVCVDARMGEVYWGSYAVSGGYAQADSGERIGSPASVPLPTHAPWSAVGNGFSAYPDQLVAHCAAAERVFADLAPRARDLIPQAREAVTSKSFVAPEAAVPVYLREEGAWRT